MKTWPDRLRGQQEAYKKLHLVFRLIIITLGFLVLLVGILMLVLPGPAFLFIPVGLAILSLEFLWAEKLLLTAIREGSEGKDWLVRRLRGKPWLIVAAVLFALGALLFLGFLLFLILR